MTLPEKTTKWAADQQTCRDHNCMVDGQGGRVRGRGILHVKRWAYQRSANDSAEAPC